jgi:ATP-dependent DNA helicase MPH1
LMYNYYRWFPRSKIIFVAPTKPLVAQQVEACFNICGIPYSHTAQLTGTVAKPQRLTAYQERRIFYMTPQTLQNDLKSGLCDPKRIVCLVIDEAHRGTGNYAYGECVKYILERNPSLRILALSATPGSSVEAVQNVIKTLSIARIEIRTENSMDLKPYIYERKTEIITLSLGPEIDSLRTVFAKVIQKFLDKVKRLNDYRLRDPLSISQFTIKQVRDQLFKSNKGQYGPALNMMVSALGVLGSLGQALALLTYHGIQPFYDKISDLTKEYEQKKSGAKGQLLNDNDFKELMQRLQIMVNDPNTIGHPKLERATNVILDHFVTMNEENQDSRVIVFAQYRSSAAELVKQLKRQEPLIRPSIFVGQSSDSRGLAGMRQKEQIEVFHPFIYKLI